MEQHIQMKKKAKNWWGCAKLLLCKMGFSSNFPRDVMHTSKEMLGLGLFLLSALITIQGLKLYFGNKRIKMNAARMADALEEQMWVESGLNKNPINAKGKPFWPESWIDKSNGMLLSRQIKIITKKHRERHITKNRAIIEYAIEYSTDKQNKSKVLKLINRARLFKKAFLSFELVESSGRDEIKVWLEDVDMSQVRWKFCQDKVDQPSMKALRVWREFKVWSKETKTIA